MAEVSHYDKVVSTLTIGKDSIFEPCKIIDFNKETLTAEVYFTHSHQRRDNVLVAFPSLFLNSGIITPPAKNSTALAFWGPDREVIVIPAQFMTPKRGLEDGTLVSDASPKQVDSVFDLSNVDLGELLFRSLGGAYVFIKNIGEVEIGTSKLHQLRITEDDGSLAVQIERIKTKAAGFQIYNGPALDENGKDTDDHTIKVEISDKIPYLDDGDIDDKTIIKEVLGGNLNVLEEVKAEPIFEYQAGNVYEDFVKQHDNIDQSELFLKAKLIDNESKEVNTEITLSKKGRLAIVSKSSVSLEANGTALEVSKDGDIAMTISGKKYSMTQIISRINELSVKNNLSQL
jgi:hypothetical protein